MLPGNRQLLKLAAVSPDSLGCRLLWGYRYHGVLHLVAVTALNWVVLQEELPLSVRVIQPVHRTGGLLPHAVVRARVTALPPCLEVSQQAEHMIGYNCNSTHVLSALVMHGACSPVPAVQRGATGRFRNHLEAVLLAVCCTAVRLRGPSCTG